MTPRSAWNATRAGGGLDLIDRPLFYELAKYYRESDTYLKAVDAPDPFVDAEIVPFLDQAPGAFCIGDAGSLKASSTFDSYALIFVSPGASI